MEFYYQAITTPTADTPGTAVLLHFPERRYIFGQISEGTQRACFEQGIRIVTVTDIFLSGRMEWRNNGGLIGTILTVADSLASSSAAKAEHEASKNHRPDQPRTKAAGRTFAHMDGKAGTLTLHGARNLSHTLATARRFVFRKGMPVYTREYKDKSAPQDASDGANDPFENPTWSDFNIKVWAMPVSPSASSRRRRSVSPGTKRGTRKRSLDEFEEKVQEQSGDKSAVDQRAHDDMLRQSIVTDMFNSTWKLDTLVESRLADVKMPAVIFIRNPETKDLERYKGPVPGGQEPLPDINVFTRQPWPGAAVEKIPPTTYCKEAMSYIVRNHDVRGKFEPTKAREHKVTKGPDYAKLTKGESVTSEDGKVITPDMVMGPTRPGKGMAIIDLPSTEYVGSLINRAEWKSPAVTAGLEAFVWILGPGVGDHPRLREFVAKMSHCTHTVSSPDYCPNYLAMQGSAGSTIQLAQLRRENYPIPDHDNVTLPQPGLASSTNGSKTTLESIKNSPFVPLEPGLIFDMVPEFELNRAEVVPRLNTRSTIIDLPSAVKQRMRTVTTRMKKPQFKEELANFRKDLPGADAEIYTLGTGSTLPSKFRNVSSTLINVPGYGYYLLDCGENTLGQLRRVFKPKELQNIFQNLRMIWISHLHADHHLGIASVIKAWYQENYPGGIDEDSVESCLNLKKILQQKRLFIVSEQQMIEWLEEYAAVEDYGFGRLVPLVANPSMGDDGKLFTALEYRHCRPDGTSIKASQTFGDAEPTVTIMNFNDTKSLTRELRNATGLSDLLTTKVHHCRNAMAVSLVFPDGFKVSFSGDCRPCNAFAEIGHGSTVLIHEATFQDNMAGSAIAKKHSTMSEAFEVGRRMEARSMILTHFSQRYPKSSSTNPKKAPHAPEPIAPPAEPKELDVPDDGVPEAPSPADDFAAAHLDAKSKGLLYEGPYTTAVDYMRIRVGDLPIIRAYTPVIEKFHEVLDRAAQEEADKARAVREKEAAKIRLQREQIRETRRLKLIADAEQARQAKRQAKEAEQAKRNAAASAALDAGAASLAPAAPASPTTTTPPDAKMDIDPQPSPKRHSAWSASESESGWDTSDCE